jgi:hypothetical protein
MAAGEIDDARLRVRLAQVLLASVITALFGLVLIGWATLPYESEERAADDILISWWVTADDAANSNRLQEVTLTVTAWLSSLFGARVVSPEALAVSLCLSLASIFLFVGLGVTAVFTFLADHQTRGTATILSVHRFGRDPSGERSILCCSNEIYTC